MRAVLGTMMVGCWMALLAGCAPRGATPAAAVGRMGGSLAATAQGMPRGADGCAMEDALQAPLGTPSKELGEICKEDLARDRLWGTALQALSAYANSLEALVDEEHAERTGKLEAALTPVRDESFVEVEGEQEQGARKATAELVTQMRDRDRKADLESTLEAAAPQVATLCDGLLAYLGTQADRFSKIAKDIEEKRKSPAGRRCTKVGTQTVCVANSTLDHLAFAELYGQAEGLRRSHEDARNTVAGFCVAHYTLAEAAKSGDLKNDETYEQVVGAVHDAVPMNTPPPADAPKP